MLQWTCHHHMLFIVMQLMHQPEGWPDPLPDSCPVGTSKFRSRRPEDHHGKVQVAMSGTKLHVLIGAVAPVQAGRLHSLLLAAHFQPEDIVTSLEGSTTSTSRWATSTRERSRSEGLSTDTSKIPRDITLSKKQVRKPQWSCFKSSTTKVKLSTGSMGTTLDPVSKPTWGERKPEGNLYPCICIFPFSSSCIAC